MGRPLEEFAEVIAFSGSRDFADRVLIEKVMRRIVRRYPYCRIRIGDARGLDLLVGHEATRWGKWPEQEVCDWPPAGSSRQERWIAAHERNGRVVNGSERYPGRAHRLIAFFAPGPRSPGTSDAIAQAKAAGVPISTSTMPEGGRRSEAVTWERGGGITRILGDPSILAAPVANPALDAITKEIDASVRAKLEELGPIIGEHGLHLHAGISSARWTLDGDFFRQDEVRIHVETRYRLCDEKHEPAPEPGSSAVPEPAPAPVPRHGPFGQ